MSTYRFFCDFHMSDVAVRSAVLRYRWNTHAHRERCRYNSTAVVVQVLVNHYERCGRYYGSGGWGSHGSATEEEKRLTMMLFSGIFDSLAQRVRVAVSFGRRRKFRGILRELGHNTGSKR